MKRRKLSPATIAADRATLKAIARLVDYQSVNPAYSIEAMQQLDATLQATEQSRSIAFEDNQRTQLNLAKIDDLMNDTGHMLHEVVCTAKAQVIALYGQDSVEVREIGLTPASQRKRPVRKASAE